MRSNVSPEDTTLAVQTCHIMGILSLKEELKPSIHVPLEQSDSLVILKIKVPSEMGIILL